SRSSSSNSSKRRNGSNREAPFTTTRLLLDDWNVCNYWNCFRSGSHLRFENFQSIVPVHEIELAIFVVKDVVAHHDFLSFTRLRNVISYLFWNVRIGKIDGA